MATIISTSDLAADLNRSISDYIGDHLVQPMLNETLKVKNGVQFPCVDLPTAKASEQLLQAVADHTGNTHKIRRTGTAVEVSGPAAADWLQLSAATLLRMKPHQLLDTLGPDTVNTIAAARHQWVQSRSGETGRG